MGEAWFQSHLESTFEAHVVYMILFPCLEGAGQEFGFTTPITTLGS